MAPDSGARLNERWVLFKHLSKQALASVSQEGVEASTDRLIEDGAIPNAGDYSLSKNDVNTIWRGAERMLDTGQCSRVVLGDKSISKPNTYYVTCENLTTLLHPGRAQLDQSVVNP